MTAECSELRPRGFTLAAILVVMAVMLLLAVGLLAVVTSERKTARAFGEIKRADWAARAGLQEVRALLQEETANDDFLILAGSGARQDPDRAALDYLWVARGEAGRDGPEFRMRPLFSGGSPEFRSRGELPEPASGEPGGPSGLRPLPWAQEAEIGWHEFENREGEVVGRFAYWVEDLQGRIRAGSAGNSAADGAHARIEWPLPAAGPVPLADDEAPSPARADQLAAFAIDPAVTGDLDTSELDDRLRGNSGLLISPGSLLAAAEIEAPVARGEDGHLSDPRADAVERLTVADRRDYLERPLVPFLPGLDAAVRGKPKRNLNRLLAMDRREAVDGFAEWLGAALPDFRQRSGGFPGDYARSLAAGALDYADRDGDATLGEGYRGIDSYPLLSEVFLRIQYDGIETGEERKYMVWEFGLFAELWNIGSVPARGTASVSYENGLRAVQVASLPPLPRFDSGRLLLDPGQAGHSLSTSDGRFWSPELEVDLRADEYRVYEFARVRYRIDIGPSSGPDSVWVTSFSLEEPLGSGGISLRWNGAEVDRVDMLVRDSEGLDFHGNHRKVATKAAVPGHSYGPYGLFVNNPGDPRASYHLRAGAAGENSYPRNASPGRRNVRRSTIYDVDRSASKSRHYGRVLPSEWPDGGHDSRVGHWEPAGGAGIEPTDPRLRGVLPVPDAATAPQRLSNAGRFLSPTELGHVFDPLMWRPAYADLAGEPGSGRSDSRLLLASWPGKPVMPAGRNRWPAVTLASTPSSEYGGGNTLRIGRPEHPRFDRPGLRAARLLDLFHCGLPWSGRDEEREGALIRVAGQVNLNTAPAGVIRTLLVGELGQDPRIGRVSSPAHAPAPWMAARVGEATISTPARDRAADVLAEAVVAGRPYFSRADVAALEDDAGRPVFGNREWFEDGDRLQWSDAAAEELFGRLFRGSTLRSRNFRVWVVGQALVPRPAGASGEPVVRAESRKVWQLFAKPGERDGEGAILERNFKVEVLYENDF